MRATQKPTLGTTVPSTPQASIAVPPRGHPRRQTERIQLGPITDDSGLSVGIFRADDVGIEWEGFFSEGGRYKIEMLA